MQTFRATCLGVFAAALLGAAPVLAADAALTIAVRSSPPDMVSGGDALIEIVAPGSGPNLVVKANGTDVSKDFRPGKDAGHFVGVVRGLKTGDNAVVARRGAQSATITLKNHPIVGPVFAGPKEQPFFCETDKFKLPDGTTLGAPLDKDCGVKTVVSYFYKPKGATGPKDMKALPTGKPLPADVDQATTSLGVKVPYVVRLETGTIDRGIYQIAMLHDPTTEAPVSPTAAPKAWNKRLAYEFFGGCSGMYRQGADFGSAGTVLDDQFLGQGYVVMSNTLNVFQNNCDDLLASEVAMMTKERAIETVGAPLFTIGFGCSGGSHQVLLTADNYPGILDGIIPLCNSVDWSRMGQQSADTVVLLNYFKKPAATGLTDAQKVAILGVPINVNPLDPIARSLASVCPEVVPKEMIYNPQTNLKGLRCTISEHGVNAIGRDPKTGFARNIVDNVGVQYGLGALNAGKINVDQFLTLNEQVGGFDDDGLPTKTRSKADPIGVEAAYRTGRVLHGGMGLRDTAVLEIRNYSDADTNVAHLKYGTFATLARIKRETGTRANYVVFLEGQNNGEYSASRPGGDEVSHDGIKKLDEWLTAIVNDNAAGAKAEKVIRNKPKDLTDSCWDRNNQRITEELTFSGGKCNAVYPTNAPPRMVAGTPESNDIIKCQLKPVDMADYKVKLSAAEMARLKKVFADGVCDWTKPGVGQVKPPKTWQTF